MSIDARRNFALSAVAVAPSPAGSGLALVLQAGGGALMPASAFNAVCWPSGVMPSVDNAEIVRVESISGDAVALIARGQEETSAKQIEVGWQFADMLTAKTIEDLVDLIEEVKALVEVETGRAEGVEAALAAAITSGSGAAKAEVGAERERAEGAENALTTSLAAETTRAEGAESTNASAIAAETTRAEGVEATKATSTALSTETARAEAAESTNATAISTEKTRAEAAEATKAGTSALTSETSAREAAVKTEKEAREGADALKAPLASPALTGTPTVPTATAGTTTTQAASTAFVASATAEAISGLIAHANVLYGTVAALPTNTYLAGVITGTAFGALSVDGEAVIVGNRVLVKNEAAENHNGFYTVTHAGAVAEAFVLTRAADMNESSQVEKAYAFVEGGKTLKNSGWFVASPGPFTLGTTAIPWGRLPGSGDLVAGTGIEIDGNVVGVSPSVESSSANYPALPVFPTDCGPALQEAFDKNRTVVLKQGAIYYLNTPVFLDSTAQTARYILDMNGASFAFGPNLPSASGLEGLAGTKWAFFNNTLRSALSGGVVTTTTGTRATSSLANYPRFLIRNGRFNANGNIIGVVFGNSASTRIEACFPENVQALISWIGSADLTSISDIDVTGHTPVGGELPSQLVYESPAAAASGDGISADRVKGFGATVLNLTHCYGFRVASPVSGQYKFTDCQGVIEAGHEETNEISTTEYSVFLNRTKLTYVGSRTNAAHASADCTIKVEDTAGVTGTMLDMIDHTDALTLPSGANPRAPTINIVALNNNGYVRLSGCKGVVYPAPIGGLEVLSPEGLLLTSSVEAITTAIAEGIDKIASGNFELCYSNSNWIVRNLNNAAGSSKILAAPSVVPTAGPESIQSAASLVEGQQYEYVTAVKRATGLYTGLSATAHVAATSTKNIALAITNPSTPCVIAIWRYKGEGSVLTAPDHYIEIPLDGSETTWFDEGARVNGRTWLTAGIPVPNTVKGTAPAVEESATEANSVPRVAPVIVTSTEELTVPAWAHHVQIVGVSGGGGGGGGGSAKTSSGVAKQVGGAGGASATPAEGLFAVTPGEKLKCVIGTGTAGGAGGEANEHAGTAGEAAPEGAVTHTSGAATLICSTPGAGPAGTANSETATAKAPAIQNGGSTIPGSSGEGKSTNGNYGLRGLPFQAPGGDSGFPASATEGGKGGQNKGTTSINSAWANQNPGNSYTGSTAGGEGVNGTQPGEGGGGGGGGAPGGAGGKGGKGAKGQLWVTWLP